MKKDLYLYGIVFAGMALVVNLARYKYFARQMAFEWYVVVIALFFLIFGIWSGSKLVRRPKKTVEATAGIHVSIKETGLSTREAEVLALMAGGLSNKEIADRLCVSTNTVKTHVSSILSKLDVERRTQAIAVARELQLLG